MTAMTASPVRAPRHALVATAARPAARGGGSTPGTFRLTRRGRLVLRGVPLLAAAAAATVAFAFLCGLLLSPAAVTAEGGSAPLEPVTVMPGDTLWTIAVDVAPQADPFQTMSRIADLNDLEGRALSTGQTLYVPARG